MSPITQKKSFSILIPDGESNNTLSIVRCLGQKKNIDVYVLSQNNILPVRYSRYISKFIKCKNSETDEERITTIISAIKETKADVLLPIDVETIRLVSDHKERFSGLIAISPVPNVDSFDTADDKWLLSQWLKENNISHPKTFLFNSPSHLEEAISSIGFPLIIKPRNGTGGGGITKVENIIDFHNWYAKVNNLEDQIIQPYICGYDIDCSVLCLKGKIIASTIQKSLKYESDNLWPYGLEFQQNDEIDSIVKKVIKLFNWSGVVHIDLRYDEAEKKIKLIEMNPRFWASVEGSVFAGVNFPYLSCLIGLNRELPPLKLANKVVFRTGPAIKATLTRFLNKSKALYYDNTYLEFIVKDPIPNFAKALFKYYN